MDRKSKKRVAVQEKVGNKEAITLENSGLPKLTYSTFQIFHSYNYAYLFSGPRTFPLLIPIFWAEDFSINASISFGGYGLFHDYK